jgi:hypothetical protein
MKYVNKGDATNAPIRCQWCGCNWYFTARALAKRLWRREAALRLTCGNCKARHFYAPGTIEERDSTR